MQTYKLEWHGIEFTLRHTPRFYDYGADKIEIICQPGILLPISNNSTYRKEFFDEDLIQQAGGVVAYVLAWLDDESAKPAWRKYELARQQLKFDF